MVDKTLSLGTIFTGKVDSLFRSAVADLDRSLVALNTLMGKTSKATTMAAAANAKLAAAQAAAAAGAKKHTKALHPMNKQISKVHGAMERFKAALKVTAAYGMAAAGLFALTRGIKEGILEIIAFDQALRNLQAITGALTADIALMSDKMRQVAITTKFSTTEIAEGMVLIGQAGFTAAEGVNTIQAVADLASGTLSSMKDTADLVTSAIRAFGLDSIDAGRVVDVFANSVNKSKLTIDKLRTSFNYIGAAAHQVGLSIEETAATMMLLANNGLRASTIGTGFRQVLARMIAPNRKLKEAFEEHGIAVETISPAYEDASGEAQGFTKAMTNLQKVIVKADGQTVDMAKAFRLFGLRGAQAVAVIVDGFLSDKFADAFNKVQEVGAAAKMAAIQAKGLAFQFKNLADRAREFAVSIGDSGVAGILRTVVIGLRKFVDLLSTGIKTETGSFVAQVAILSTALIGLYSAIVIVGKALHWLFVMPFVQKGLGQLVAMFTGLGTVFTLAAIGISYFWAKIKQQAEAHDKLMLSLEKEKAAIKGSIHSLNAYRGALEETIRKLGDSTEVGAEHAALIERLSKAHPELGDLVSGVALDYDDLTAALARTNVQLILQGEKAIDKAIESLDTLRAKLKQVKEPPTADYSSPEDMFSQAVGVSPENVAAIQAQIGPAFTEVSRTIFAVSKVHAQQYQAYLSDDIIMEYAQSLIEKYAKSKEEVAAMVDLIMPALKKYIEALRLAGEAEEKSADELKIAEIFKYKRRFWALMASMETDHTAKIEAQHKVRLNAIKQYLKDKLDYMKKKGKIDQDALDAQEKELTEANNKRRLKDLADYEYVKSKMQAELRGLTVKKGFEEERKLAAGNAEAIAAINEKQRRADIAGLEEMVKIELTLWQGVVTAYGRNSDEALKAAIGVQKSKLDLAKAEADLAVYLQKDITKKHIKELKERLKYVKEYSEEWKTIMIELAALEGKTVTELQEGLDRMAAKNAGIFAQFRYGWNQAKIDAKDFGDTVIEIGEDIADVFADEFTSAFMEFVHGTMSAKEAFEEFAESTLDWLLKMIVRQTIYNALVGGVTSWMGGGDSGGEVRPHGSQTPHSGGVIGTDAIPKRYHSGGVVGPNEVPAILEKGEGVFTKGQMAAMGGVQDISVNITNKSETPLEATSAQPQMDMGRMILNVVLEGTTRNKGGFKDGMKGALG